METLELAMPVKGVSLKDLVVQMEIGEEKPFSLKNDQSIRSAISSRIKVDYPERIYKTRRTTIDGNRVLVVIREK